MDIKESLRCPVCRAKFRGTRQCSRCGADLTAIMVLSARAQGYRANAKKSLYALNFEKPMDLPQPLKRNMPPNREKSFCC